MESHLKKHGKLYIFAILIMFLAVYGFVFWRLHALSHKDWNSFVMSGGGGDSGNYLRLAENIKNHGVLSLAGSPPFVPSTINVPGYPLFILALKSIFGSYIAVTVLQLVLVLISGYLIFRIGQKLISMTAGFFAALLFIFSTNVMLTALFILTDLLYTFLTILAAYVIFFRKEDLGRPRDAIAGGLLCGVAILVRPVGLLLPIIFGLFLFISLIKKGKANLKKSLTVVLLLELAAAVVIMPWVLRNRKITGAWNISSNESYNVYLYDIPRYLCLKQDPRSCYDNKKMDNIVLSLLERIGYKKSQVNPLQDPELYSLKYTSAMTRESLKIIEAEPLGYASYHAEATLPRFFLSSSFKRLVMDLTGDTNNTKNDTLRDFFFRGDYGSMWQKFMSQPFYTLAVVWLLLTVILSALSVFKIRSNAIFLMFLVIIVQYAVITGPTSYFRYRLPADPFIILSAMAGLSFLVGLLRKSSLPQKN